MKKYTYLLLLALLPQLTSCGGDNANNSASSGEIDVEMPEKKELSLDDAQPITFDEARNVSPDEEKKPVTIEGYFQVPYSASISSEGQSSYFFERRNQTNGDYIYVSVPLGKKNNQMVELKSGFLAKDFKAKDNNGTSVGVNERVKITGFLYTVKSYSKGKSNTVYLNVKKIEKVDEIELDYEALDFPTLTKDEYEKRSNNRGKPYMIEGRLEVPMFVLTGEEMSIDIIDGAGNKYSLQVLTGDGNNQMETLPSNWTQKDIKIRDSEGTLLPVGTKVRAYGVIAADGLHVEQIKSL